MCGIVGYIGKKQTDKILIELLKRLEYRGYDSAGVALLLKDKISVTKSVGKISKLESILKSQKSTCGISHTRWATHGRPSQNNAHPHVSEDNKWAIVHNGIIENYVELKKEIAKNGIEFEGETDSEVIAKLLGTQKNESHINCLINACKNLKGSYSLACINNDIKDTLFLAKNKSPLYVSLKDDEVVVGSDPICFVGFSEEYFELNDGEFCEANTKKLTFYNENCEKITKNSSILKKIHYNNDKKGYKHYMIKEIEETSMVLKNIVERYKKENILNKFNKDFIKKYNNLILIGCGTAYHAGLMGAKYISDYCRINSCSYIASEFRYSNPIINNKTLCILVSQSGETADTIACCELAKKLGATTIALTNVEHSTLARMVSYVLPTCAGQEIAVASTKAYSAQIAILYMFAMNLRNCIKNKKLDFYNKINNLAIKMVTPNLKKVIKLADEIKDEQKVFFLGRGLDYITAEESSLKLKEISYINSSAHPSGELKHGFLALVEDKTYVFTISTDRRLLEKTLNGAHEASSRGANVVLITNLKVSKDKSKNFKQKIKLQQFSKALMPIVSIIFFQLLAYYVSVKRGLNPDQPRNLAKSVTVE